MPVNMYSVHETFEAESDAVVVAVEIVSVAAAAVEVERQTVAVLRVEVPARRGAVAGRLGLARGPRRHRLVAVARPVPAASVAAAPSAVRGRDGASARRVAVVLRRVVVSVAAAAGVHERPTLGHVGVPVEPQVLIETRAGLFRQQTGICQRATTTHIFSPSRD